MDAPMDYSIHSPAISARQTPWSKRTQRWQILIVGSLLILLTEFGFFLPIPPQTKIFKDILCRKYYAAQPPHPSEQNCKITPVQIELARINGGKDTFDALPSITNLVLSCRYSGVAKRYLDEICLWVPLWFMRYIRSVIDHAGRLLSSLLRLLGGGDLVVSSIVCVMVADAFPEDDP
jgi:hypothetical protein